MTRGLQRARGSLALSGLWLCALLLGSLGLAGCGQGGVKLSPTQHSNLLQLVMKAQQAQLHTPHLGQRAVHVYAHVASTGAHHFATLEQVATDGHGGYALQPLSVSGELPTDPATFLAQHADNAAFYHRFRDFMVRDLDLFIENYLVLGLPVSTTVAGRACITFECKRAPSHLATVGGVFTVSLDVETAFVLAYEERDKHGNVVAAMNYETIDYAADLSGITFSTVPVEQVLNLSGDPSQQLGFQPLLPKMLPSGYKLDHARMLSEGPQKHWACFEYTDGVEKLFFLHGGSAPKTQVGPGGWTRSLFQTSSPYRMYVTTAGSWTIAQGVWDNQYVVAVGKLPQSELLPFVESALP
ncbi:MAG: hypothetical protein EPO68_18205 [Planctomycetota bacterium]|nr:MAG: hypothetical protein EPO68_18205 [Planctomycetota bacterium]